MLNGICEVVIHVGQKDTSAYCDGRCHVTTWLENEYPADEYYSGGFYEDVSGLN